MKLSIPICFFLLASTVVSVAQWDDDLRGPAFAPDADLLNEGEHSLDFEFRTRYDVADPDRWTDPENGRRFFTLYVKQFNEQSIGYRWGSSDDLELGVRIDRRIIVPESWSGIEGGPPHQIVPVAPADYELFEISFGTEYRVAEGDGPTPRTVVQMALSLQTTARWSSFSLVPGATARLQMINPIADLAELRYSIGTNVIGREEYDYESGQPVNPRFGLKFYPSYTAALLFRIGSVLRIGPELVGETTILEELRHWYGGGVRVTLGESAEIMVAARFDAKVYDKQRHQALAGVSFGL